MSTEYPDDLRYTKEHEWARVDGNVVTIGITRFAVESLGDITQVDLPKEGEELKKDSVFGTVESVKAVSDLFAPVNGKVVKVNDPLGDSPEYINEDPYDEGWMVQVEMKDKKDLDGLMSAADYQAYLKEQESH
ncbi:MAG TPA: glycine cleavage system protein GcvH [Polyangia bacterium]|jgi:glycine cleavage system H protein|nr:glycine cleavage system protein GcvH [Polyangia bacterium]HWE29496.1 glycine cleavage system protein GcvH [Polyangia bacterium]